MPDPKNKKVSRDTIRINKPSKIYKPGDYVTEDDFEAQFKKIEGDASTFPQYSVQDYSTIQVDEKGPYVVKESGINMGSPLYKKMLTPVSPFNKSRCWTGWEPVPGKKPYSKGSCRKK
jgi:hypothetical protein